jgi:hypothetical protein
MQTMYRSFGRRLGAVVLLLLFVLPFISTEWHEIALARYSLKHPWRHCSAHGPAEGEVICSGHGAHSCAMCDFGYAKVLLFEPLASAPVPAPVPVELVKKGSRGILSLLVPATAVRGPPPGYVLSQRLAQAC